MTPAQVAAIFDYADRQGHDADGLMAELPTPGARRRYVASFYTNRVWCPPGVFASPDLDLLVEPYADADTSGALYLNGVASWLARRQRSSRGWCMGWSTTSSSFPTWR